MGKKGEFRGPDGLTDRERRFVALRVQRGDSGKPADLARDAGYAGNAATLRTTTSKLLLRPHIKRAIERLCSPVLDELRVSRKRIIKRVAEKFFAKEATPTDVARLGKLLAEMTPGALVPTNINITKELTLEQMIEAAGGKPDVSAPREMKN